MKRSGCFDCIRKKGKGSVGVDRRVIYICLWSAMIHLFNSGGVKRSDDGKGESGRLIEAPD
jgi:hypothetical protein